MKKTTFPKNNWDLWPFCYKTTTLYANVCVLNGSLHLMYPSNIDGSATMELSGFKTTHPHNKVIYHGIRLLTDNELGVEDDFLS